MTNEFSGQMGRSNLTSLPQSSTMRSPTSPRGGNPTSNPSSAGSSLDKFKLWLQAHRPVVYNSLMRLWGDKSKRDIDPATESGNLRRVESETLDDSKPISTTKEKSAGKLNVPPVSSTGGASVVDSLKSTLKSNASLFLILGAVVLAIILIKSVGK